MVKKQPKHRCVKITSNKVKKRLAKDQKVPIMRASLEGRLMPESECWQGFKPNLKEFEINDFKVLTGRKRDV